jgi:hypothetical protein
MDSGTASITTTDTIIITIIVDTGTNGMAPVFSSTLVESFPENAGHQDHPMSGVGHAE